MDIARLTAIYDAEDRDFQRGNSRVQRGISDTEGKLNRAGRSAQSFWSNMASNTLANLASNLLQRVSTAALGLIKSSIESAASMEGLKRGLASVAGSSEEAERQLVRLREVAKSPGLGFREAIQGSVRLQAVGLNAELAERSLKVFGNALATVGGRKEDLDGVTLALTQIVSKGKVSAEEINQIAERVPQIRKAMKDAFGTADTEALQKMNLSTTEFIDKISTELGKIPQLTGGAANAMDNFKDSIDSALVTIGGPLLEPLGRALEAISPMLGQVAQRIAEFFSNIPQLASGLVNSLPQSFQNAFGIIWGIVQSVGSQIVGWFTENLPLIQQTITTVLTAVGSFWATWGETVKKIVQTAMSVILGVIKLVMNIINGDWKAAWETIRNVVKDVMAALPGIIKDVISFVVQAGLLLIKNLLIAVGTGLRELPSIVGNGIRAAFNAVIPGLASWLLEQGMKLGRAIVDGIWDGFISIFDSLATRVAGRVKVLAEISKATLDAHSPSRVFIKIGKSIPEGLAIGIESGFGAVERSMEKLLETAIGKFAPKISAKKSAADTRSSVFEALTRQAEVLRELAGSDSALETINRLLKDPAVARIVDKDTAALLRFNATLEDTLKLTRERFNDEEMWRFGNPAQLVRDRIVDEERWRENNPALLTRERRVGLPDDMRSDGETRARRVLPDLAAEARERAGQIADELTYHIGGAFRDLLDRGWRGLLSGMLDTAKNVFAQIGDELINQLLRGAMGANQQGKSGGIIGMITGALLSAFGGGISSSFTSAASSSASAGMGGFAAGLTPRAMGGDVNVGTLYKTHFGDGEVFVPNVPGQIYNKQQQRAMGGGTVINKHYHFTAQNKAPNNYFQRNPDSETAKSLIRMLQSVG